jgi:hypothetical protein
MALTIPFIDAILDYDLKVQFNQRHTAHRIWEQLQVEVPGCDVGESTVRRTSGPGRLNWMELSRLRDTRKSQ